MRNNEAEVGEFIEGMDELVAIVEEALMSPAVASVCIGVEIWYHDGSLFLDSVDTNETGGQP